MEYLSEYELSVIAKKGNIGGLIMVRQALATKLSKLIKDTRTELTGFRFDPNKIILTNVLEWESQNNQSIDYLQKLRRQKVA